MPVNEIDEAVSLISLEEARLFCFRNAADSGRDELLIDAINDVSGSVAEHCNREFKPTGTAEARVFGYDGQGELDLSPYDLRTLTSVTMYTDLAVASQVTLTASQYRLEPAGRARGGTYLGLVLPYAARVEPEYGFGWQVTVTGDWGMASTPYGVKFACKQWVDNIVRNPGSYASQSMGGYTVVPEQDDFGRRAGMPPAVRHRLEVWRRSRRKPFYTVRFAGDGRNHPTVPHTLPTV